MARRSIGEYVPLSVSYMDDDAVLELGDPLAELLYVRVLAVAGQLSTDGYLTEAQIVHRAGARLGTPAKVRALLKRLTQAGLVEGVDGGYQIRAWLKWNKSAEELGRDRAKDRDRKRAERSGQPPDDGGSPPSVRADTGGTPVGIHTESDRSPNGVPATSDRSPVSRAPAYAQHGTARNGTTQNEDQLSAYVATVDAHERAPEPGGTQPEHSDAGWLAAYFADRQPLTDHGKTLRVVADALAANYTTDQVRNGLDRLADQRRGCSRDQLRIAIVESDGNWRPAGPRRPGNPYLDDLRASHGEDAVNALVGLGPDGRPPLRAVPELEAGAS